MVKEVSLERSRHLLNSSVNIIPYHSRRSGIPAQCQPAECSTAPFIDFPKHIFELASHTDYSTLCYVLTCMFGDYSGRTAVRTFSLRSPINSLQLSQTKTSGQTFATHRCTLASPLLDLELGGRAALITPTLSKCVLSCYVGVCACRAPYRRTRNGPNSSAQRNRCRRLAVGIWRPYDVSPARMSLIYNLSIVLIYRLSLSPFMEFVPTTMEFRPRETLFFLR